MATNTTSHHLTQPPSTIGHMNTNDRVRDELTPPTSSRQRGPPSPRTQSKSILTIALQKAQTAVQFDAANNVAAALDAYKQTVELLTQVIDKAVNEADRRRLQLIHDTYADRIRLLSTIAPEPDSSSDNSTSSKQDKENNDDTLTQDSEDPNVKVNSLHRTDSIDRKSIQKNDSQTSLNKTSENEDKSVDKKIDNLSNDENSNTRETTITNDIDLSSDIKESIRNDTVDYMTPQPKRLSDLSRQSSTSSSTSKSWISTKSYLSDKTAPMSVYDISADSMKSIADSGESTPRSSDLDSSSSSEDSSTINDYLQNSDSYDVNSENIEENFIYQNQDTSSQQEREVEKQKTEKISINTSQLTPSTKVNNSPSGNRVFVPPPPPKIAPPNTPPITSPTPNVLTGRRSTSPTIVPPPSAVSTTKQNAPPISPIGSPSDDDDKASIKSAPNVFTRPSSPPPQSPVEKLLNKALPHSRRPAPLPLAQPGYNSRTVPVRSPSNPNIIVTQNNSTMNPRRTASNPGNHSKKSSSVRFFNASQGLSPQPSSPWMSSFSIISPPLGSPGLGPPTGSLRSEMSSISTRSNDASYTSCLLNPFPNASFYDEDIIGLSHMSSNNGLPEPPPSDIRLKPFWLMRLLERTMTTGGYLTPKLFIPQYLWLQGHVKLTAIDSKISSCEVVSNCLEKLEKISFNDLDKLSKALEGIDPILEGLQNSLARKLSYVESTNGKARQSASSLMSWGSKLSRGLDKMGMGNAMVRSEEANGYVDVLLKVFHHAEIVENYIKQYTSLKKTPHLHHHKQIIVRLYKFADFLGNVICRFVVRDLGILADKYLKKGSHWIVE